MSPVAETRLTATSAEPGVNSTTDPVRVMVIDDHRVFAELLALALDGGSGVVCVAVASTAAEGLAKAAAYTLDVIVLDVRLPDASGLELIHELVALRPTCRVIVLTANPRADHAERALSEGAVAFLAKDERLDDLLLAIRSAQRERPMLSTALPPSPHGEAGITPRELDVLAQLACGQSTVEIAAALQLSTHTVRDHIKAILAKLEARSQLDAVLKALELGIVESGTR